MKLFKIFLIILSLFFNHLICYGDDSSDTIPQVLENIQSVSGNFDQLKPIGDFANNIQDILEFLALFAITLSAIILSNQCKTYLPIKSFKFFLTVSFTWIIQEIAFLVVEKKNKQEKGNKGKDPDEDSLPPDAQVETLNQLKESINEQKDLAKAKMLVTGALTAGFFTAGALAWAEHTWLESVRNLGKIAIAKLKENELALQLLNTQILAQGATQTPPLLGNILVTIAKMNALPLKPEPPIKTIEDKENLKAILALEAQLFTQMTELAPAITSDLSQAAGKGGANSPLLQKAFQEVKLRMEKLKGTSYQIKDTRAKEIAARASSIMQCEYTAVLKTDVTPTSVPGWPKRILEWSLPLAYAQMKPLLPGNLSGLSLSDFASTEDFAKLGALLGAAALGSIIKMTKWHKKHLAKSWQLPLVRVFAFESIAGLASAITYFNFQKYKKLKEREEKLDKLIKDLQNKLDGEKKQERPEVGRKENELLENEEVEKEEDQQELQESGPKNLLISQASSIKNTASASEGSFSGCTVLSSEGMPLPDENCECRKNNRCAQIKQPGPSPQSGANSKILNQNLYAPAVQLERQYSQISSSFARGERAEALAQAHPGKFKNALQRIKGIRRSLQNIQQIQLKEEKSKNHAPHNFEEGINNSWAIVRNEFLKMTKGHFTLLGNFPSRDFKERRGGEERVGKEDLKPTSTEFTETKGDFGEGVLKVRGNFQGTEEKTTFVSENENESKSENKGEEKRGDVQAASIGENQDGLKLRDIIENKSESIFKILSLRYLKIRESQGWEEPVSSP